MKRAAIVLVVLRLVAISVVVFVPRVTRAYQLARARARWDRCGMQSYTWTISGGGFLVGGGPVEIGGPGRSVRLGHARGPGGPRSGLRSYPRTVPELFDRIADATGADGYAVTYDDRCGFPQTVSVDPSRNATDDEFGFQVLNLRPST
jgi:hypothetical protein